MRGETNPILVMAAALVFLTASAAAIIYLGRLSQEDLGGASVARFTLQTVRGNVILLRNDGTSPMEQDDFSVTANGVHIAHTLAAPIEPSDVGEVALQLVPGECHVKLEVIGGFKIESTDASLCIYEETFDDAPGWDGDITVEDGIATVTGSASGDSLERNGWVLQARVRGEARVTFLDGYAFGVFDNETAFFVDDEQRSGVEAEFNELNWYIFKVASEQNGVFFGRVWEDGTPEPQQWSTFLTDSRYDRGAVGIEGTAEIDYLRVYLPET